MRYNEETVQHKTRTIHLFQDAMCAWYWEIDGRARKLGFDFAWYNDSAKEREAAIEVGKLCIDHRI
jgi:hypothetical protein